MNDETPIGSGVLFLFISVKIVLIIEIIVKDR